VVIELWAVEAFVLRLLLFCLFFVADVVYVEDAFTHTFTQSQRLYGMEFEAYG
jgi:hypothetical protein